MDHFIDILRSLSKHRLKLIVVPALVLILIGYLTRNSPKTFKTEAKLYLNLQEGKEMSLTGEDLKQYQVQTYFTNTVELLKSRQTVERVKFEVIRKALTNEGFFAIGNESLIKHKVRVEARLDSLEKTKGTLRYDAFPDTVMLSYLRYHQLDAGKLRESILCFRIMDSNFMKFEMTESTPDKTRDLANIFIDALIEENRTLSRSKIKGHKDIIEALVRQAKADLDDRVNRLEEYKVKNAIINLGEHTKAIVVYLVQLEGQRATLDSKVASSIVGRDEVYKTITEGNPILVDISSNNEFLTLKNQLQRLNRDLLATAFKNNGVLSDEVINKSIESKNGEIRTKVLELTRKASYDPSRVQLDLVSKYLAYDLEAHTAEDMIRIVNNEISRVTEYSKRFAPFESIISSYDQDIATAQQVYLTLLNKLNLTESMEYGSGENVVEVIDRPYLPDHPEPSKRMVIIAAGTASSFVIMAVFFIIVQLLDTSVNSVEKFERVSKLPVAAGIPNESLSKRDSHLNSAVELITRQQSSKLMQQIIGSNSEGLGVILIASGEKAEGKHFIARKLEGLIKAVGHTVSVIDADWMSEESIEGSVNLKQLVYEHGLVKNRLAITAAIEEQKGNNDFVMVIAAPVNLSGEAEFWLSLCHRIVYVFRANRILKKVDKRTEHLLLNTRTSYFGTVINGINVEFMEDYLGEIPKKRNVLRIFIKKLLTRNFK